MLTERWEGFNMDVAPLTKQIADAFPVEPIPTRDEILYSRAIPGESEVEEIKLFFAERPWNSITPSDVFRFRHALSFFSPRSLAYYTAAWMTCSLSDEDTVDTAIEDLVSTFDRVDVNLWTQRQRSAICRWLTHFLDASSPSLKKRFRAVAGKFGCDPSVE